MNEVFAEQIIKSKASPKEIGARIMIIMALIMVILAVPYLIAIKLGIVGFTLFFLCAYLTYYVFKITDIEFEYSVANADFYVEKIMGQIKRKKCRVFNLRQAIFIVPENSDKLREYSNCENIYDYSSRTKSDDKMVAVFNSDHGIEIMYFEPNEKIAHAIKSVRPNLFQN
ncbi:MAG: hypothetical protein E7254_02360 [Lachnospiraceae bacterium]|nr:hypothetical protein [Lachnospiraceae bacterium]